ncbi:High mobility group B protein 4, partial [Linum perenne]
TSSVLPRDSNFHIQWLPKRPFQPFPSFYLPLLLSSHSENKPIPSSNHNSSLRFRNHSTFLHLSRYSSLTLQFLARFVFAGIAMKGKSKADVKKTDAALKPKGAGRSTKKAAKDPNKPKRPPSAFFVFMEEFRQLFKEQNPNNKSVAAVSRFHAALWPVCDYQDKAPYKEKADKRKTEYEKTIAAYNMKLVLILPHSLLFFPDIVDDRFSFSIYH